MPAPVSFHRNTLSSGLFHTSEYHLIAVRTLVRQLSHGRTLTAKAMPLWVLLAMKSLTSGGTHHSEERGKGGRELVERHGGVWTALR